MTLRPRIGSYSEQSDALDRTERLDSDPLPHRSKERAHVRNRQRRARLPPVDRNPVSASHGPVDAVRPFVRRPGNAYDAVLQAATPATLLDAVKKHPLPATFTPQQQHLVRSMLDQQQPQLLARSPLIDAKGIPMPLRLASTPLTDVLSGAPIPVRSHLERGVVDMFKHHAQHQRWEQENFGVRKIRPGEAEPALDGQEGVYAKKFIPAGTPVSIFGGMYLDNPADIHLDAKVRAMAGLPPDKYRDTQISRTGGVLQAMGATMKCNSGGENANLFPIHINAIGPGGEKILLRALFTASDVAPGQELRMNYPV